METSFINSLITSREGSDWTHQDQACAMSGETGYKIPPFLNDYTLYFEPSKYRLVSDVVGGFADMYTNTLGRQKYAIKSLRHHVRRDEAELIKDFNLELEAWLRIGLHENVLQLAGYCFLPESPHPCLLSHWQENGQVNRYLKQNDDVNLLEVNRLELKLEGVILGLRHMHEREVVHGDLRGGNILVSRDGVPRLADFGLSRICDRECSTSSGHGTFRWMAKEMICSDSSAPGVESGSRRSKASDVWSLGMTILELLSGEHPYCNYKEQHSVILAIARGEKPNFPGVLHESWTECTDVLLNICDGCWKCDPSRRPSVQDLHDDIRDPRGLESNQSSDESDSDDSLPTPRALPRSDPAEILESIESLSLSDTDLRVGNGEYQYQRSYEPEKQVCDPCKISYMTAFMNHLMASKQSRKPEIHSEAEGPQHAPRWYTTISVDGTVYGSAFAPNKKLAQEEAARQAFTKIENEEIDPDVLYLPVFLNRLNARGSKWHSQFSWHLERSENWRKNEWVSILYWNEIEVGRGRGSSQDRAKGEAARAAALTF